MMARTYLSLLASLASLLYLPASAQNDPIPLPQNDSDINQDPAVTWGVLDNGLRFAILPNAEPPNRVSMRLYVDAGSLMEDDNQQGLAHFLEHMAFNGTTNFPPGEMVEYFQRLGMGFGNHTNAHTSFNETVYKLELPNSETEMIAEGMGLLRDYADGMLLLEDEIEDERGIILSEKRTRDSVSWRTFVEQIKFAFPKQRISTRLPIGTEEVIKNATRERFVEFYESWYTANRMAVVVVGDIDTSEIETVIREHFDSMEAREKRADPEMGNLANRDLGVHYHYEDEAGETSVSIEALKTRRSPPDDRARRLDDLQRMIAARIINRRLERLTKAENSPISSATMHAGDFFDLGFALYSSIDADCKPEDWKEALKLIEQELRRALEHGFTESELNETKAVIGRLYEDAAKQMGTRKSRDLANEIARRIGSRRIFTSPAEDLQRVMQSLDLVTTESTRNSLRNLWESAEDTLLMLSGNADLEDAVSSIKSVYDESAKIAVTAPEEKETAVFAYGDLPEAGEIAKRKTIEDIDVTQITFANNVKANFKTTKFEDETIYVKARIGAGRLTEPSAGLSLFASSVFNKGGLEAHSHDDLKQIFAAESVNSSFGIDDDAFTLSGQTTPQDLSSQLTLMRAYLTNPGYREEAALEFRKALDYIYQQLERTPEGFAQNEVAKYLHSGDDRFGYPKRAAFDALTTSEAREWLSPALESAYLEISVVGNFDLEEAIKLVASTFGNLPDRKSKKPKYKKKRSISFPEAATVKFSFKSEIPKAMAIVHWPTTDIYDIQKSRRLSMLSAILDDRLRVKVREELGDAYSPFAHNLPSDTWTDYGYLFASVTVAPDQADAVTQVIAQIANDLATGKSISKDELDRAKKPQVTSIEEMRRTNRYWMVSVLESSQEYPDRLDWSRSFVDDYKNITVEEVNSLAKEYLSSDTMVAIVITPEA